MSGTWDDAATTWDDESAAWDGAGSPAVTVYMRPPEISDNDARKVSALEVVIMWSGADATGIAKRSIVGITN